MQGSIRHFTTAGQETFDLFRLQPMGRGLHKSP